MTKIAFDIDGVITANPAALSWLTYHLKKNENDVQIYIVTWRNGADPQRKSETIRDLERMGISYHKVLFADRVLTARAAAYWKVSQIRKNNINIWFDDEIKIYKRDYNIDLDRLLPGVVKIWI